MYLNGSTLNWLRVSVILLSADYAFACWGWWGGGPPPAPPPSRPDEHIPIRALMPGQRGKPEFCFERFSYGDCNASQTRWGFNPDKQACERFPYSGCGGNANKFNFKKWCDESCTETPKTMCNKAGVCPEYEM